MSKHTPGPWEVVRHRAPEQEYSGLKVHRVGPIEKGARYAVAQVGLGRNRDPEDLANARLIAAAPEMLAALRAIEWAGAGSTVRSRFKGNGRCPDCGARHEHGVHYEDCRVVAAIAKAEG